MPKGIHLIRLTGKTVYWLMALAPIGVIHGRFQPLHIGHIDYLLAGKSRCNFLYIGITNPDPSLTRYEPVNPQRSLSSSNPFNYYERLAMIRDSLIDKGISRDKFEVIPFPINIPEILKFYAPEDAVYYATIYDKWGEAKVRLFKSLNLKVEVMWRAQPEDKVTSGTQIRELIARGEDWSHLVPTAVFKIIKEGKLESRVKDLLNSKQGDSPLKF